jgi:hypothetical protein
LGIVWLSLGVVNLSLVDDQKPIGYLWLGLGVIYLLVYLQQARLKYLSIENGILKENWIFGKSIVLKDVKQIRHFAGDYILKSPQKKMIINLSLIDNMALLELTEYLKTLDSDWI